MFDWGKMIYKPDGRAGAVSSDLRSWIHDHNTDLEAEISDMPIFEAVITVCDKYGIDRPSDYDCISSHTQELFDQLSKMSTRP